MYKRTRCEIWACITIPLGYLCKACVCVLGVFIFSIELCRENVMESIYIERESYTGMDIFAGMNVHYLEIITRERKVGRETRDGGRKLSNSFV